MNEVKAGAVAPEVRRSPAFHTQGSDARLGDSAKIVGVLGFLSNNSRILIIKAPILGIRTILDAAVEPRLRYGCFSKCFGLLVW